jgi:hypothetical protein
MKIFCKGMRRSCSFIFDKFLIQKNHLVEISADKILRRYVKHQFEIQKILQKIGKNKVFDKKILLGKATVLFKYFQ